ncbi:MAG: flagella basal body P-ring formation protein FlgA [Phycisphaerales bacterium]
MIRALLTLLILLCGAPALGDTTTVSLRIGARVSQGEPVTLAMIADLTGPLAESLGGLVIEPDAGQRAASLGPATVSIDLVRDLVLKAAEESAVVVRGTACELRIRQPLAELAPAPRQSLQTIANKETTTLRDQITAHLLAIFAVERDSIRLTYEDRDATLLDTVIQGRVAEVRAIGSGRRVPLSVAVYEGDRVVAEGTVRVEVSLRRSVVVLNQELSRGVTVSPEHFTTQDQWVEADDDSCTAEQALGQMTRRRARAGETLTTDLLEAPIMISRGDIVTVRSVRGAAVVRLRARALGDGRLGEQIELEHTTQQSGRDRRSRITARVIGPGRALIGATGPQGTNQ